MGLFFETAQGNSIGKTLFEDIDYWNKMRKGEKIPLEYLQKCHNYHELWLNNEKDILFIDASEHYEKVKTQIRIAIVEKPKYLNLAPIILSELFKEYSKLTS